jgi:WD40 repeat protein
VPWLRVGCSYDLAWSPDGRYLAAVGHNCVRILDAVDLSTAKRIALDYACRVELSPDGQHLLVGAGAAGTPFRCPRRWPPIGSTERRSPERLV